MMKVAKWMSLLAMAGVMACAGGPERGDEVVAQVDDRENLEWAFLEYLESSAIDPDLLARGAEMEALGAALDEKVTEMEILTARLNNYVEGTEPGTEEHSWAMMRLARLYLNLGCELEALEPPSGLSGEESVVFRASLGELSFPVMARSRELAESVEGDSQEAERGEELAEVFAEAGGDFGSICDRTRSLWTPESF